MTSDESTSTLYPTAEDGDVTAFCAFESQLRTLCLTEFPCGLGNWRADGVKTAKARSKRKQFKKSCLLEKYAITLRDFNAQHEMVETLAELASSKRSPWTVNYDWSEEARALREMAIKSPWIIDKQFICSHFKTLRIVDRGVTEVDENMLLFTNLEQLSLTANYIRYVNSQNLPRSLRFLELCANELVDMTELCIDPPTLVHIGLGYNHILSIADCLTGQQWPELRSVDLAYNQLTDLVETVGTLHSLPKLRNLVLFGNPFTLVPAYRGYTIDTLRKLEFLDDVPVTVDEKHYFKGISKMTECNVTSANILLSIPKLRGLLPPEEIANPEGQPEFPKISRKYLVQFLFVYEAKPTEIVIEDSIIEVEQPETLSPEPSFKQMNPQLSFAVKVAEAGKPPSFSTAPLPAPVEPPPAPLFTTSSPSGLPLVAIRSPSFDWTDEPVELNWAEMMTVGDLRLLRDFCAEGMQISVVEETVLSYPKEEEQPVPVGSSIAQQKSDTATKGKAAGKPGKGEKPSGKGKDEKPAKGKNDKKPAKPDPKADKAKGKKGKKEPEIPLVHSPPEYTPVATWHIPLSKFLDGDFSTIDATFSKDHPAPPPPSPTEGTDKSALNKKDKDKKSADKKDVKKDTKAKDKKGKKGRGKGASDEEECHALEVHAIVKFCHWNTAADVHKDIQQL